MSDEKVETRKDSIGRIIRVGDTVASTVPNYSYLAVGKVIKFNPKMIKISDGKDSYNRYPDQVVRVDYTPEDLAALMKKNV